MNRRNFFKALSAVAAITVLPEAKSQITVPNKLPLSHSLPIDPQTIAEACEVPNFAILEKIVKVQTSHGLTTFYYRADDINPQYAYWNKNES